MNIYWPTQLKIETKSVVLGWTDDQSAVIVGTVAYHSVDELVEKGLLVKNGSAYELNSTKFYVLGANGVPGLPEWDKVLENAKIIVFTPPKVNLMQFYSVEPISLVLKDRQIEEKNEKIERLKRQLDDICGNPRNEILTCAIQAVNLFYTLEEELHSEFPDVFKSSPNFTAYIKQIILAIVFNKLSVTISIYGVMCLRLVLGFISYVLQYRIGQLPNMVEVSALAQQVDLRCQQFCYFPVQYLRTTYSILAEKQIDGETWYPQHYPDYIRLYNSMWLIINDVLFGMVIGAFVGENKEKLETFLVDTFETVFYKYLKYVTTMLTMAPLGIKFNDQLAQFLSELFSWIIEFWADILHVVQTHLPLILSVLVFSSKFGATFIIAVFNDLMSLLTLHFYLFYFISAKLYYWQLSILIDLFYLFCGKKRNVLRDRIDSTTYETDQLLMGTLMFIVMIFLLPTVFGFYVTFAVSHLLVLAFLVSLENVMAFLNHFPLFVLLLRIKDPKRIPGGIQLDMVTTRTFSLRNKPLQSSTIFKPYTRLFETLKQTYFSKQTIIKILTGMPIYVQRNKLYQLLYSSLPSQPISIDTLWTELQKLI